MSPTKSAGYLTLPAMALSALIVGSPVAAQPLSRGSAFDGSWSAIIYTQRGACDEAYRSGVQIQSGIIFPGASGINWNGRVSPKGAVRVSVSAGGQSASGSGRLSRNSGGGTWHGQGNRGGCSGTWTAERRR
jgi:hypothetical protein